MPILCCISPYAYADTWYNTDRGDNQIMAYDVLEVCRHVINYSDSKGARGEAVELDGFPFSKRAFRLLVQHFHRHLAVVL